jgi:hypothetical protein
LEDSVEVALAGEAESVGDLNERQPGRQQILGASHTLLHDIAMRRASKGIGEEPEKLPWAHVDELGEMGQIQVVCKIGTNVIRQLSDLGFREPSLDPLLVNLVRGKPTLEISGKGQRQRLAVKSSGTASFSYLRCHARKQCRNMRIL